MDFCTKEFLLAHILCAYDRIKIKDKTYKVITPSLDILYEANEIFDETLQAAIAEELFFDEDIYNLMLIDGLWTRNEEQQLVETLPELVSDFQKKMFFSAYRETECEEHRVNLKKTREKLSELYGRRHYFDSYTCQGVAMWAKHHFIVHNTTYNLDGNLTDWADINIATVIDKCNLQSISQESIREISRTAPWVNQWGAIKSQGNIFGRPPIELSPNQQLLLMFSKMYDNINESPDCPDDFILEDDDLLDGWILVQKEKREKERAERQGTELVKKNSKFDKADEIFIIADGQKDIDRINKMNSARGNIIKKNRLKQLFESKDGKIDHKNFADVKQQAFAEIASKGKG